MRTATGNPETDTALDILDFETVAWCQENPGDYTRVELGKLVHHLTALPAYKVAVAHFADREVFKERPMVEVGWYVGAALPREKVPVIWLLGWRKGEATPIHDHVDSQVAVQVTGGVIAETIYWPEGGGRPGPGFRGSCRSVTRELLEGSTALIPAPYIHRFEGTSLCDCGVSCHAYFPRLEKMNYFELEGTVETGKELVHTGLWEDIG